MGGWVGAMKPSTNILLLKSSCGNKGKEGRREREQGRTLALTMWMMMMMMLWKRNKRNAKLCSAVIGFERWNFSNRTRIN